MREVVEYQSHLREGSGKLTFLLSDGSVLEVETDHLMGKGYWDRVRKVLREEHEVTDPKNVLPVIAL
jgi:hypothetical protein